MPKELVFGVGIYSSDHRGDHRVDPANIVAAADLVIPILTPFLTPRVLDDPERLFLEPDRSELGRPVAHQKHTVVQMPPTDIRARHSSYVRLHEYRVDTNCTVAKKEKKNTRGTRNPQFSIAFSTIETRP